MVGQGLMPAGHHPLADAPSDAELREFLALIRQAVARQVAGLPAHDAWIARHCAAGLAAPEQEGVDRQPRPPRVGGEVEIEPAGRRNAADDRDRSARGSARAAKRAIRS